MQFTRDDMIAGLRDLGIAAARAGRIIDLAVYGGSCLMLVSNFRQASQDVDAVATTDQPYVDRLAGDIAARRGWPGDWLNDGVDGERDRGDIESLIAIVGITTPDALISLATRYYPEARVSSKLRIAAQGLIRAAANTDGDGEAPRYFGRRSGGEPAR